MATIEERSYKAFCGHTSCRPDSKIHLSCINCLHDSRKDAYIKGATDQREIDIEKAQRAFCKICGESCILASYCEDMQIIRDAMMED